MIALDFDTLSLRLALGIEPVDPVRGGRIAFPVTAAVDGVPLAPARTQRDPSASPWDAADVLERIPRTDSCRFRLLDRPGLPEALPVRLWDEARLHVPRRVEVELPNPTSLGRVVRPALFPGAAYGVPAGAVGCRGSVTRDGAPLRWARVIATRGGSVVGRAHGDDRGEFLLLLGQGAATGPDLDFPLSVTVTVFGPDPAPDPAAHPEAASDPLWDLPLEAVPLAAADATLAGTVLPPGYRSGASRAVDFFPDGLTGQTFVFT